MFCGKTNKKHGSMLTANLGKHTPLKINMEHNHGGLEDHFPFQTGDLYWFVGSMLVFQGVTNKYSQTTLSTYVVFCAFKRPWGVTSVQSFLRWCVCSTLTLLPCWSFQPLWLKICSSNWKSSPEKTGWKFQKQLRCHHRPVATLCNPHSDWGKWSWTSFGSA